MIHAQVNLLPPELGAQVRARRVQLAIGIALVGWLGLLGGVHAVKSAAVEDVRAERDVQQTEIVRLQGVKAQLTPFGQMQARLDEGNTVLMAAMQGEVAVSQLLDEVAQAFPPSASMRSLTLDVSPTFAAAGAGAVAAPVAAAVADPAAPVDPAAELGPIGRLTFDGYTVEGYAPGVESVLVGFSAGSRLVDGYAAAAQEEDLGGVLVTGFSGRADVTREARTGRYAQGLPPADQEAK